MGRLIKKGFFWGQKGLLKLWSVTIGFLLSTIFGSLTSCMETLYGVPVADFQIKGKITSSKDGTALKDIKVTNDSDYWVSDSSGRYYLDTYNQDTIHLSFEDTNTADGSHHPVDTFIVLESATIENGDLTFDITMDPVDNETQD